MYYIYIMNKKHLQEGHKCGKKSCKKRNGGESNKILLSSPFIIFALLILAVVIYMYYTMNTNIDIQSDIPIKSNSHYGVRMKPHD